jgi:hypothetical protein
MTQVKEWSNAELNRALAELMGKWIGDCCTDPAASLEVEQAAIKADAVEYMRNLAAVKWGRQDAGEMTELSLVGAADLHLVSPRERAEAAYITLSQVHKDGA